MFTYNPTTRNLTFKSGEEAYLILQDYVDINTALSPKRGSKGITLSVDEDLPDLIKHVINKGNVDETLTYLRLLVLLLLVKNNSAYQITKTNPLDGTLFTSVPQGREYKEFVESLQNSLQNKYAAYLLDPPPNFYYEAENLLASALNRLKNAVNEAKFSPKSLDVVNTGVGAVDQRFSTQRSAIAERIQALEQKQASCCFPNLTRNTRQNTQEIAFLEAVSRLFVDGQCAPSLGLLNDAKKNQNITILTKPTESLLANPQIFPSFNATTPEKTPPSTPLEQRRGLSAPLLGSAR